MAGNVTVESLQETYDAIVSIDEKIDAASGTTAAGKRAMTNRLVEDEKDSWTPAVQNFVGEIRNGNLPIEKVIGVVNGIISGLTSEFGAEMDEHLDAEVERLKSQAPEVSESELEELLNEGREQRKVYDAMRTVLDLLGEDVSGIPTPKRLSGARGPRGPRLSKKYNYTIDGKGRSDNTNTLSSIYQTDIKGTEGCEDWTGTKQLKEFMAENGFDFDDPQDEFEVTLPNNKVLGMTVASVDESYGSDGDEGEEQ